MIDYEKLIQAHEKCLGTKYYFDIALGIDDGLIALFDSESNESFVCNPDDLDDLIAKLQELTQPKAKYEVGQKVWTYSHDEINYWVIQGVRWDPETNDFRVDLGKMNGGVFGGQGSFLSKDLYPQKSELIQAQIDYWRQMRIDEAVKESQLQFEGEIKGFGDMHCSKAMNPHVWLEEDCQHECKWDGVLVSKSPNMGRCRICKQMCYVVIDFDKWHKGECDAVPINECQHESTGDLHHLADGKLYHTCDKCDEYFIKCEHESNEIRYVNPYYEASKDNYIRYKCKKCGEFYK